MLRAPSPERFSTSHGSEERTRFPFEPSYVRSCPLKSHRAGTIRAFHNIAKMRYLTVFTAIVCLSSIGKSQPSYSDRDDSEFKAKSRTVVKSGFRVGDTVKFPRGTVLYPNLNDLKYYEGPDTTIDETRRFKGRFVVGDGGVGSIRVISSYINTYNRDNKAYRVLIYDMGYLSGRKLQSRQLEGWLPGDFGMYKR